MFALVDANNFYASCERLFRPDLAGKPIIVLSNNDGCVVARSNEAKALGIDMAIPYFKVKQCCYQHQVHVFSSNYTLYGDLSARVMTLLEMGCPNIEVYSIDEAFLQVDDQSFDGLIPWAEKQQQIIKQHVGIPVSIGIGKTKTLAKVANHIAKTILRQPVCLLDQPEQWLSRIPVDEVWGIGKRWGRKLQALGIINAQQLANTPYDYLRKHFNVVLARTALELQGQSCLALEAMSEPKKNIVASKSFGQKQIDFTPIAQALSTHCARACEKLRTQSGVANYLHVSLKTNRFSDQLQYHPHMGIKLPIATDDSRMVIAYAKKILGCLYKPGFKYHKVGVMLGDIHPRVFKQNSLLSSSQPMSQDSEPLMAMLDQINRRYGRHQIYLAAMGMQKQTWKMQSNRKSPAYTTCWQSLAKVY
ncbi:MAG: Y-family DNA polymerase [Gammaproteobacteria bacterium]|nr:Y-family DNA polymerase [Gammaproteobacteria bacterium]